MKRRDFLKYGIGGAAGATFGGFTRMPVFRLGDAFASSTGTWKFGVLGDTQWTKHSASDGTGMSDVSIDPEGTNPYSVPGSIISQIDQQFVEMDVKFVIQVGDLTDCGTTRAIQARADIAQANLIANGIDFFPERGNHETYGYSNGEASNTDYAVSAMKSIFPQMAGTGVLSDATNFTWASSVGPDCLTYSFDCGNVRFIMLDAWATGSKLDNNADGYAYGYTVADQQAWLDQQLDKATRGTDHAFVFAHQPLIAEDHQDTIFSGYTNANPDWQNAFYASMANNNARYFISGHDHIHQRSLVASPDGNSVVEELICASCSNKFYTPQALTATKWYGQKYRETSISQEMYTVGFYVYSVNGPIVMVDYYSDDVGQWYSDGSYPTGGTGSLITPTFNFVKKETWGYTITDSGIASFSVSPGSDYVINTTNSVVKILKAGKTAKDYTGRSFQKPVEAWWADKSAVTNANAISDVVTVLGAASAAIKENHTSSDSNNPNDAMGIQLSFDPSISLSRADLNQGRGITVCTLDENGQWVNAVEKNFGGTKRFVYGAYNKAFPVGTYGVDNVNKVAWAVVNHDSDFAVIKTGE